MFFMFIKKIPRPNGKPAGIIFMFGLGDHPTTIVVLFYDLIFACKVNNLKEILDINKIKLIHYKNAGYHCLC